MTMNTNNITRIIKYVPDFKTRLPCKKEQLILNFQWRLTAFLPTPYTL